MKTFEKEYENKFNDYRDEDEEKKKTFIPEKLSKLSIHHLIIQTKLDELCCCIRALCGMKVARILGLKQDMHILKIWMKSSLKNLIIKLLHNALQF